MLKKNFLIYYIKKKKRWWHFRKKTRESIIKWRLYKFRDKTLDYTKPHYHASVFNNFFTFNNYYNFVQFININCQKINVNTDKLNVYILKKISNKFNNKKTIIASKVSNKYIYLIKKKYKISDYIKK